jgi:hypothetical protein
LSASPATQDSIVETNSVIAAPATDTAFYKERKFEPDFQKNYDDANFKYEIKATGTSQWERFKAWLYRILSELFSTGDKVQGSSWTTIAIRVIAIAVILFVVYLIVKAILNKESVWIFGRSRKNITVNDITEEDIRQMNFGQMIEETKKENNYRLAIRYYYLWLLKRLANREIIDWHWEKTNGDYLYEIKDNNLRKDFEYLSYVYEYSWYGDFPIDEAAFSKAEKAFQKTLNTL